MVNHISQSSNLLHLDLSNMLTSEVHLKMLIKAISFSSSLQVVHLDGTSMLREIKSLIKYLMKKLGAKEH
jgi:hypothetical protein